MSEKRISLITFNSIISIFLLFNLSVCTKEADKQDEDTEPLKNALYAIIGAAFIFCMLYLVFRLIKNSHFIGSKISSFFTKTSIPTQNSIDAADLNAETSTSIIPQATTVLSDLDSNLNQPFHINHSSRSIDQQQFENSLPTLDQETILQTNITEPQINQQQYINQLSASLKQQESSMNSIASQLENDQPQSNQKTILQTNITEPQKNMFHLANPRSESSNELAAAITSNNLGTSQIGSSFVGQGSDTSVEQRFNENKALSKSLAEKNNSRLNYIKSLTLDFQNILLAYIRSSTPERDHHYFMQLIKNTADKLSLQNARFNYETLQIPFKSLINSKIDPMFLDSKLSNIFSNKLLLTEDDILEFLETFFKEFIE
jgi:hypothetical protein